LEKNGLGKGIMVVKTASSGFPKAQIKAALAGDDVPRGTTVAYTAVVDSVPVVAQADVSDRQRARCCTGRLDTPVFKKTSKPFLVRGLPAGWLPLQSFEKKTSVTASVAGSASHTHTQQERSPHKEGN
jgi:hypothetical protein